jgi:hypothetical protein
LAACDDGGLIDTDDVIVVVSPNAPPVAHAGLDQTASDGDGSGYESMALDGSASHDADGSIAAWEWSEDGVTLGSGETLVVEFGLGSHTVTLTVTDDGELTASDDVSITVHANMPPLADAGLDQTASDSDGSGYESVILDASASYDPDGVIVVCEWSEGAAMLGSSETLVTDFDTGAHTVTLTVTDNGGLSTTDDVAVTVIDNEPPVADAGPDIEASDGDNDGEETLTLDGSASHDPDGVIVAWEWSEDGAPLGSGETLVTAFGVGTHVVVLAVTDDGGLTEVDDLAVVVNPNQAPAADAGPDQAVTDGDGDGMETILLDGAASSDADGVIVNWEWSEEGAILGLGETLVAGFGIGSHAVTLAVTDNGGATTFDDVTVTVGPNRAPVAQAGPDQTVTDADGNDVETIVLDAAASYDGDGAIVTWEWSEDGTELGINEVLVTDFGIGSHIVTLTVTDNGGAMASDQVLIEVERPVLPVMRVAGIDMSLVQRYFGWVTYARAWVEVVDADGAPVAGAVVTGHWENATSDSDAGITAVDGMTVLDSDKLRRPPSGTQFTFVVDEVAKDGWLYHEASSVTSGDVSVP